MKAGMCWHICCVRINCPVSISAREASGFRERSSCPAHKSYGCWLRGRWRILSAALLFLQLHRQASYALYFLAAVSLCTGVYNLMPFGVLDGARLLQNLLPAEKQDALRRAQRLLLCLFCAAALGFALLGGMPRGARAGGFPGAGLSAGKGVQAKIKKKGLRSA